MAGAGKTPDPMRTILRNGQTLFVCGDPEEVAEQAADLFVRTARAAISERGIFAAALSGGQTPEAFYAVLASDDFQAQVDWKRTHLFFSDERCVPPGHKESNFRAASRTLFSKISIPPENIHRMPAERPDLEQAALDHENEIRNVLNTPEGIPEFDLIFLGLGEDGHIASLFPQTAALDETRRSVVKNFVLNLNRNRLTFTFPLINNARNLCILVEGLKKAGILRRAIEGEGLPVHSVRPEKGRLIWITDQEAFSLL
jgi:6-phosphogluconolactonase